MKITTYATGKAKIRIISSLALLDVIREEINKDEVTKIIIEK